MGFVCEERDGTHPLSVRIYLSKEKNGRYSNGENLVKRRGKKIWENRLSLDLISWTMSSGTYSIRVEGQKKLSSQSSVCDMQVISIFSNCKSRSILPKVRWLPSERYASIISEKPRSHREQPMPATWERQVRILFLYVSLKHVESFVTINSEVDRCIIKSY